MPGGHSGARKVNTKAKHCNYQCIRRGRSWWHFDSIFEIKFHWSCFCFVFLIFGGHKFFCGPLIPLFWTSDDVSSGFQSQSGFCLICSCWHLLTSWWPSWQESHSHPHTCKQALVGLETRTYCTTTQSVRPGRCCTNWAIPPLQSFFIFCTERNLINSIGATLKTRRLHACTKSHMRFLRTLVYILPPSLHWKTSKLDTTFSSTQHHAFLHWDLSCERPTGMNPYWCYMWQFNHNGHAHLARCGNNWCFPRAVISSPAVNTCWGIVPEINTTSGRQAHDSNNGYQELH